MELLNIYIDDIIKTALKEDINYSDITTDNLITNNSTAKASFVSKDDGVISGLYVAKRVFELLDSECVFTSSIKDGDTTKKGDIIATIECRTRALLKGERTALNLLQHMSGISTQTSKCVKLIEGTGVCICETRKTLPGLRAIQKYSVLMGGGKNHRFNLSDAAMLKDNHIDAYGGIGAAVKALKEKIGHMVKIEVETRNLEEVAEALNSKVDVIMLDNMDYETMKKAVLLINKKAIVEASGNISLENILDVANTGIDVISIGALTHSVKAFDISLKININPVAI